MGRLLRACFCGPSILTFRAGTLHSTCLQPFEGLQVPSPVPVKEAVLEQVLEEVVKVVSVSHFAAVLLVRGGLSLEACNWTPPSGADRSTGADWLALRRVAGTGGGISLERTILELTSPASWGT